MASYDIPAGSKYAGVITCAIRGSACLVLVLTEASQSSLGVDKGVKLVLKEGKAAGNGNAEAMIFLASYYRDGTGVRPNYREAEKWCRLAIKNGSRDIAKQAKEMLSYIKRFL